MQHSLIELLTRSSAIAVFPGLTESVLADYGFWMIRQAIFVGEDQVFTWSEILYLITKTSGKIPAPNLVPITGKYEL